MSMQTRVSRASSRPNNVHRKKHTRESPTWMIIRESDRFPITRLLLLLLLLLPPPPPHHHHPLRSRRPQVHLPPHHRHRLRNLHLPLLVPPPHSRYCLSLPS